MLLKIKVYEGAMDAVISQTAEMKDETGLSQIMSRHKPKFKSNQAADKALKRMSVYLVEELNLFDTTIHLYAMDGLTPSEMERLRNHYETELEKRLYLVTTVIPSKGQYKGMKLLMRALRQTEQYEVLSLLEKTYDEEVDIVIAEKQRKSYPIQATTSNFAVFSDSDLVYKDIDGGGNVRRRRNVDSLTRSTSSSSDEYDDDDVISLDSPVNELICDAPIMKFVFFGDVATGKTSLLQRYINNKFSSAVGQTVSFIIFCSAMLSFDVHRY